MTPLFPAQRAAEEFDKALGGTATEAVADRYAELLDTVEVLRAQPEVLPRAEFVDDLRARLMTAAETELVAAPDRRTTRAAGAPPAPAAGSAPLAASLVIVGGTAGMAAAASGALPGEPLYPVKRGIEQAGAAVRLERRRQGQGPARPGRQPPRRGPRAAGRRLRRPRLLAADRRLLPQAADAGSTKLFTAYQAEGDPRTSTTVRDFTAEQMADVAAIAGGHARRGDRRRAARRSRHPGRHRPAGPRPVRRLRPGGALAPPEALSAGAGAATMNNLLARPVAQAQGDVAALEAARVAALKAGASLAEATAGKIPRATAATDAAGRADRRRRAGAREQHHHPDGSLVPSSRAGAAVNDLVTGVTGTVDGRHRRPSPRPATPLDETWTVSRHASTTTTKEPVPDAQD